MEELEKIFPTDKETLEKLKGYAINLDYEKVFFEHLGPELKKIFKNKKDKIIYKNFLDALQYEYGFFGQKIDLQKAFSLYKKYADDYNDYFCMYKLHVIYLCDYEKFNIPFNRVLEKIYLLKCFAYVPNYILDLELKLFEKIDLIYELALILDLEDNDENSLDKHELFFDLLNEQREKFNLSENDVLLMKGCLFCFFKKKEDDPDYNLILFSTLNSIMPKSELDFAYYNAKTKCVYFKDYLNLNDLISDSEVESYFQEIKEKKLYAFYSDYGEYFIDKKVNATPEIIEIFTVASENGDLFSCFKAYQCLLDYYDFDVIMSDYDKAKILLGYLLDNVVFEKLSLSQFILLMGCFIKHSKYKEKIIDNYLVYVKEINEFNNRILNNKEIELEEGKKEFYLFIKAYIYYFGFEKIEKQNFQKAVEYLDKGIKIAVKNWVKKIHEFIKYHIKKLMNDLKLISNDELNIAKKDLFTFYSEHLNLKYEIIDCYITGKDYLEGFTKKQDEFLAFAILKSSQKIFCGNIIGFMVKNEIKKFLKDNENKIENTLKDKLKNKLKDETCCICYDKKIDRILIPCEHYFCSVCAEKIEKSSKCPICRGEILCVL